MPLTDNDVLRLIVEAEGPLKLRASGMCMFPLIRPGDILYIAIRPIEQIRLGEVAVWRRTEEEWVAHRVIETGTKEGRPFICTRADRHQRGEGPFFAESVVGVVYAVMRGDRAVEFGTDLKIQKNFFPALWARLHWNKR